MLTSPNSLEIKSGTILCIAQKLKSLVLDTLPETNMAPETGWLEYYIVSFWGKRPIFRG